MSTAVKLAAHANHSRSWGNFHYVYPVVSRRSEGLSIGVNLNVDTACNFDCVYCCVDRTNPVAARRVNLAVLRQELRQILDEVVSGELFRSPLFDAVPPPLWRLNDVAFSGNGEPAASPAFPHACETVAELLSETGLESAKIVLITNSTLLHVPRVAHALRFLDRHNGEIWAKLDAGTEGYYRLINRTRVRFSRVLANILAAGRERPIVIQSMFVRMGGQSPSPAEIEAYTQRLLQMADRGCRIKAVHVYTVARRVADLSTTSLPDEELDEITGKLVRAGLPAQAFYAPN